MNKIFYLTLNLTSQITFGWHISAKNFYIVYEHLIGCLYKKLWRRMLIRHVCEEYGTCACNPSVLAHPARQLVSIGFLVALNFHVSKARLCRQHAGSRSCPKLLTQTSNSCASSTSTSRAGNSRNNLKVSPTNRLQTKSLQYLKL